MITGAAKRGRRVVAFALLLLPLATFAQVTCEYSCPEKDLNELSLATDSSAIGYESSYSIFECIYSIVENSKENKHTCNYYKNNGEKAIGHANDACPPQGVKCSEVGTPRFSAQGKYEVPPWIETGRYSRYLIAHPIPG